MTVLLLELNEINFSQVLAYVRRGELPVLGRLIATHGITETVSEHRKEELEPWIQWVTAHTGFTLSEHGVFRLGDIVWHELSQIWEVLEEQGLKVGAISPMNAKNRCKNAAFFIPDPWTPTPVTGSGLLKKLYRSISQAVNDNAQARLTPSSAVWLLLGLCAYARPQNYIRYISLILGIAQRKRWRKALVLDQLLADIFLRQLERSTGMLVVDAALHMLQFNFSVPVRADSMYQGNALRRPASIVCVG
jgi:hypothetical protein